MINVYKCRINVGIPKPRIAGGHFPFKIVRFFVPRRLFHPQNMNTIGEGAKLPKNHSGVG